MRKMNGAIRAAKKILGHALDDHLTGPEIAEIIHREAVADLLAALEDVRDYFNAGCWCLSGGGGHSVGPCQRCIVAAAIARYEGN